MKEQITVTYYEEGDVYVFSDGLKLKCGPYNFQSELRNRGYFYSEKQGWTLLSLKPWVNQTVVEREYREPDI